MQKLIGISAISAILILSIGILPPPQQENDVITYQNQDLGYDTLDDYYDNLEEFDINNLQEIELSIIETERVFTESDQSLIERFLDENDLPSSSEKLAIEVQTVLFDSDQKQYPSSNIIGIPELSVYDEQNRLLDLGTIQTSFLAITANTEKSFTLDGTVKFYLDDTLITTKRIYGSDTNTQNHELALVDSLPNTSFDRPKAFTFTLSDEGRDWQDESEHIYRVVLTQINAQVDSDNDFKSFSWTGENVVYDLKVKVDEAKKVILDENNSAIQIFKNNNTLQLCGKGSSHEVPYAGVIRHYADPPDVIIRNLDGDILLDVKFFPNETNPQFSGKHAYGQLWGASSCSEVFTGIPRGADLTIELNFGQYMAYQDKIFNFQTPTSQKNYFINADFTESPQTACYSWRGGIQCDTPKNSGSITSTTTNILQDVIEWQIACEQRNVDAITRTSGNYIWQMEKTADTQEICDGNVIRDLNEPFLLEPSNLGFSSKIWNP